MKRDERDKLLNIIKKEEKEMDCWKFEKYIATIGDGREQVTWLEKDETSKLLNVIEKTGGLQNRIGKKGG